MSSYYVIAIGIAVGAVALTAIGLTREDFPPTVRAGRILMAGTALLVTAGIVALLATTHREHPREEAAHAAAERAADQERGEPGAGAGGGGADAGGGPTRIAVTEDEFSIALEGGEELEAGPHVFAVANRGEVEHDLAIEGEGLADEPKTPIIEPGRRADLEADLEAGEYRFYCTVPGHEEAGMAIDVTVR